MRPLLTRAFISKLESISTDIKYYINVAVGINENEKHLMDQEDFDELIDIRNRIKSLKKKLETKI